MKKILLGLTAILLGISNVAFALPPTRDTDFKKPLITDSNGKNETLYNPNTFRVSANSSFRDNVYNLFSPNNDNSVIWGFLRVVMIWVLVLYFAWTGIDFMFHPNDEAKSKAARKSFMYMLFGAFLVYGVTWILWRWLAINDLGGSASANASGNFVNNFIWRVLFQVLAFLKAFAFFYAIVMALWFGFLMIRALDKEDAIKSARKWLVNVLLALVFIKVIDFVFFIAQDIAFISKAKTFMINIARIIGYLLGAGMVLALIYTWYKYISAWWDEAKVKWAKDTLSTIFYIVLIIFLFLLVARQVIWEFA